MYDPDQLVKKNLILCPRNSPRLKNHGATVVKEPQKAFWGGYSGYFSDPDGHTWEIAYNSFWTIRQDGRVSMEKD